MNEEELKKGCGKKFVKYDNGYWYFICGGITKTNKETEDIVTINPIPLCDVCQARLEGFQKGKLEERERFGRIIHDLEDDIFNMSSLGMLSYMNVITRIKQLQKEIGEEKQDDTK